VPLIRPRTAEGNHHASSHNCEDDCGVEIEFGHHPASGRPLHGMLASKAKKPQPRGQGLPVCVGGSDAKPNARNLLATIFNLLSELGSICIP
jgi:hypothetical protein